MVDWVTVRDEPGRYVVKDAALPDGSTASETILYQHASTRGHSHPHAEMLYVVSGFGAVHLDGGPALVVHRGDMVWIDGGRHHRVTAGWDGMVFLCTFTGSREASRYGSV